MAVIEYSQMLVEGSAFSLQSRLAQLVVQLRERDFSTSLALVQVWVGSESNTGKRLHQNGTNVCLTTSGLPSFIHQADLLNFRTECCKHGIIGSSIGVLGQVWDAGSVMVVQCSQSLPRSTHPRNKLAGASTAEAVYIPVFDATAKNAGVAAILEVLVSAHGWDPMVLARTISATSDIMATLQLSLSKPAFQEQSLMHQQAYNAGAQAAALQMAHAQQAALRASTRPPPPTYAQVCSARSSARTSPASMSPECSSPVSPPSASAGACVSHPLWPYPPPTSKDSGDSSDGGSADSTSQAYLSRMSDDSSSGRSSCSAVTATGTAGLAKGSSSAFAVPSPTSRPLRAPRPVLGMSRTTSMRMLAHCEPTPMEM